MPEEKKAKKTLITLDFTKEPALHAAIVEAAGNDERREAQFLVRFLRDNFPIGSDADSE